MSSAEDAPVSKKRKLQRACDYCRRKKIKCDGPQMPNNRCSRCASRRTECTYEEGMHKSSYVESLERRLERMEKLVSKLHPDINSSKELDGPHSDNGPAPQIFDSQPGTSRPEAMSPVTPPALAVTLQTPGSDNYDFSDEDEEVDKDLTEGLQKLTINGQSHRYHGKSSGLVFIRSVLDLSKRRHKTRQSQRQEGVRWGPPWLPPNTEDELNTFGDFPPEELMVNLVDLYFRNINDHLPLLHEPTFKKAINNGLHRAHGGFGATVLLVCANGSRFTQDPRVRLNNSEHPQPAGWRWFHNVSSTRRLPLGPAELYDLQVYVLMVFFLQGTTAPQTTWNLIGVGIRVALDVGAHRKKMYSTTPTAEEELWRRAFWMLVILEWTAGHGFGRPSSIYDEDIDLDLPTECDDEYWTTPEGEMLFKQSLGKPSKVSFFKYLIRLTQILSFATRTIYSINKSRTQLEHKDQQWEQSTVAELDSALNKWVDSLPEHLRWDLNREDTIFLSQSATLFAHYYQFQIAVHRPFMSSTRRESPLSFPSLIICTNAARSSIQVLEALYKRTGTPYHRNMGLLFMSSVVLMMNILGQKRSGRPVNADRDLAYVQKCVEMLETLQSQMHASEPLRDTLNELMSAANTHPTSQAPSSASNESSTESHGPTESSGFRGQPTTQSRKDSGNSDEAIGSSLASITLAQPTLTASATTHNPGSFQQHGAGPVLPLRTEELSRIPPYGFTTSSDGAIHSNISMISAFPHSAAFQSAPPGPAQPPPQPQLHVQGNGGNSFDSSVESIFGLDPLGYNESAAFLPAAMSNAGTSSDPPQYLSNAGAGSQERIDRGVPDFAFIDDTLTMWSNAPTSFGWDDWGTYVNNTNGSGT